MNLISTFRRSIKPNIGKTSALATSQDTKIWPWATPSSPILTAPPSHSTQFRLPTEPHQCMQAAEVTPHQPQNAPIRCCCTLLAASAYHLHTPGWVLAALSAFLSLVTLTFDLWPPKWEKLILDSSRRSTQSFTPSFSTAEKSVTVHTNEQTEKHNKLNTPPYYHMVG